MLKSLSASLLGIALALSALPAHASSTPVESGAPVPLLWKVSDADNSVYLLGSFHVLRSTDYPLSADVDAAFEDAARVVFEVTPDELASPDIGARTLQLARFEPGRQLSSVLPAGARERLDATLQARGASFSQFDAFEPWFVTLSMVMELSQSAGLRADHGLDQHLMRRAAEAGKPIAGLETLQAQLTALDSTPMDEQVAGLAELIDAPEKMREAVDNLHSAWRAGDAARLDRISRAEMRAKTPGTYRLLNVDRNLAWLPQVRAILDGPGTDNVLIVVGAMHLLGEDGLVEMLRDAGYRIARICTGCTAVQ